MSIVSTQSVRCTLWFVCDARTTVRAYARLRSLERPYIVYIRDIEVTPLANVGRKRLRNLLALTSALRFESAVVERSYGGFFDGKVNANGL